MGNRITNAKNYDTDHYLENSLKMNNGLTSVFIDVLSLNTSHFASNSQEVDMAIWLACRDQTLAGRGAVGFDINKMPWASATFLQTKQFILKAKAASQTKHLWHLLDYQPYEEWVVNSLVKFGDLIQDFTPEFISIQNYDDWQEIKPVEIKKCPIHGVFHHWYGCVVCNNSVGMNKVRQ